MVGEIRQVRNSRGNFICETFYEDGIWVTVTKKKSAYTYMLMFRNGSIRVINTEHELPLSVHYLLNTS